MVVVFLNNNNIMMITLIRTDSSNKDFVHLVKYLDEDLAEKDGDEHAFYNQFNKLDQIRHVIVAYGDGKPVGCGAIKEYSLNAAEVKRMYTLPEFRGRGIAGNILHDLEKWAAELSYERYILETGKKQTDAIGLYEKHGYSRIENYGQYRGVENSLCYEKRL